MQRFGNEAMEKTVNGLGHLLSLMFVLALPLFLVTSNVRVAFNTQLLYEVGFDRHDVESRTGLSSHQLTVAAEQIREYFNSEDDLIKLRIPFGGTPRSLDSSTVLRSFSLVFCVLPCTD